MSKQRRPASALLPVLAEAFPRTFFADPKQVRPLKINLHRDLNDRRKAHALPVEISLLPLRRFLHGYTQRTAYLKALARGESRIDLTGTVVTTTIPDALRQQARAEVRRRQANRTAQTATPAAASPPPAPVPKLAPISYSLEDLYAMAIDAKLEVTLKFSTLPKAKPAGQGKMAFALKTPDGQFVTAEVGNKLWNQLVKAHTDWPPWVAALTGTMGARTEEGFALANPGLQVFEKKAKTTEATPRTDTPPAPAAPAEPVAPPPPAVPATVTTGAGTATVTVTRRAPLSLKRNGSS